MLHVFGANRREQGNLLSDPQKDIAMLGVAFWLNELAEYVARDAVREWADMASILRVLAADAQATQDKHHELEMAALKAPNSNVVKARFG